MKGLREVFPDPEPVLIIVRDKKDITRHLKDFKGRKVTVHFRIDPEYLDNYRRPVDAKQ
jgi:hypothetical protein